MSAGEKEQGSSETVAPRSHAGAGASALDAVVDRWTLDPFMDYCIAVHLLRAGLIDHQGQAAC
ncbi:hypothetical protein D3C80_2097360 [compost metagenome]